MFIILIQIHEIQLHVSLGAQINRLCSELPEGQFASFECGHCIDQRMHEVYEICLGEGIAGEFLFGDGLGEGEVVEGAVGVDYSVYDAELLV